MSNIRDHLAAQLKYSTRLVWGEGQHARISRCLDMPMVRLYATKAEAEEHARAGKRCCRDCKGVENHATEFIPALEDSCPVDLGERERRLREATC
jgi:hypothetical protein